MSKKELKRRSSENIKKRKPEQQKKLKLNTKIAILLGAVAILLISYMAMGILLTAAVGLLLFFCWCVWLIVSRKGKKRRKVINIFLIFFLLIGIACMVGFSLFVVYIKGKADPKYNKKKLNTAEISRIYDRNGNEIAKLGSEKREKVTYDELPEVLVDAIIATEDSRFFQHNGLDAPRFIKYPFSLK